MVTWLLTNLCTHILQVYLCVFTFDIDSWVSGCIEYACIWYWSPRFSHEMNVFTNKTKKCVHKICMNITQLNVHSDVHLEKKKVKLSYNNISIHLGAENTEVYCLKFIKKTKTKTQIFSTNKVSFKNKGNSLVSVI